MHQCMTKVNYSVVAILEEASVEEGECMRRGPRYTVVAKPEEAMVNQGECIEGGLRYAMVAIPKKSTCCATSIKERENVLWGIEEGSIVYSLL